MRLRYVTESEPGFTRRYFLGFPLYFSPKGWIVFRSDVLRRIRHLGIPPAYTDVWICPYENGHIQAIARDARGRRQYIYHEDWIAHHSQSKFDKLLLFARVLSTLRRRVRKDLALRGMPKSKVVAAVVRLLDTTFVRIGNDAYAKENGSYGLTTLEHRHVKWEGESLKLRFRGKEGVVHTVSIDDERIRKIIARCQDIPGHELFEYFDDDHEIHVVSSEDVNGYLHAITGDAITAKDFRTWHGTVLAADTLWNAPLAATKRERMLTLKHAIEVTAQALGNTPAVCRSSYIHPMILQLYRDGMFVRPVISSSIRKHFGLLHSSEKALVALLR